MSNFDLAKEKRLLLKNLQHLKSLPVKEYTFHKKCDDLENVHDRVRINLYEAMTSMWMPKDIHNEESTIAHIENLKPKVIICDDDDLKEFWRIYRQYVSSGVYYQTPGRFVKFIVVDANATVSRAEKATTDVAGICPSKDSGRLYWPSPFPVIGLGAISSDIAAIGCRDEFIGWTIEQKFSGKKLNNIAIGSTIVATQPFGFNFLGAKLIAALITSEIIRNEWQLRFGDVLAGMTTTSLFGFPSIYDNLKWWNRLQLSKGDVIIPPDAQIYKKWLKYVQETKRKEYTERMTQDDDTSGPVTNYKGTVLDMIYKTAGIPIDEFKHGFERGVYFSEFYENTKDFLTGKIDESELKLKPLFQDDVNGIMKWWIPEAIGRYKMLKKKNRLKPDTNFYNQLGYMDYETAKETFFDDVGR